MVEFVERVREHEVPIDLGPSLSCFGTPLHEFIGEKRGTTDSLRSCPGSRLDRRAQSIDQTSHECMARRSPEETIAEVTLPLLDHHDTLEVQIRVVQ